MYQRYAGPPSAPWPCSACSASRWSHSCPYLIFLACPLMMMCMMRGHGGHGGGCQRSHGSQQRNIGTTSHDKHTAAKGDRR